ncbi:MAG: 3-phosphoshikimate 1-carboxyvinyltransferase [Candidatus Eremiobacteraeota bacterium]|nr:3-phosphoshikimate 1-carboxyvinyltransferase [Candidatus Eremiobacteraeota bacterium]
MFAPGPVRGRISVPGDKSISHRALLLAAKNDAPTSILNLNPGLDVRATTGALRATGTSITGDAQHTIVRGGTLHSPSITIDCMNSGTTARLFMGLCAGAVLHAQLDGDASLRRRPMEPVSAQLRAFGAQITTSEGALPATIWGAPRVQTQNFILLAPSAQVKSALLLAGLYAQKPITISADHGSRDHTERMLRYWGSDVQFDGTIIRYEAGPLKTQDVHIPADLSSAAPFIVAAAITPGSDVCIPGVGLNPTRTGLLDALTQMGAHIEITNRLDRCGEPLGDLRVRHSALRATNVGPELALRAIDEILLLATACSCAHGTSTIRGIRALRGKESDRVDAIGRILHATGMEVDTAHDAITIGGGTPRATNAVVESRGDHRTAMAVAALACIAGPLRIDDDLPIVTSFPGFVSTLRGAQAAED